MSIIIFSRPIHTGKTTELLQWTKQKKNIYGVLMPDIEGKRHIVNIETQQSFVIECSDPYNTKETLQKIGSYNFYSAVFDKANSFLIKTLELKPSWLVIDEIGKLELMKKGFYKSLKKIIESNEYEKPNKNLLLVIRDSLYKEAVSFLGIKNHMLVMHMQEIPFSISHN